MKRHILFTTALSAVASSAFALLAPTAVWGQLNLIPGAEAACSTCSPVVCDTCPQVQDYRLVPQTIYEHKPVTTRRLQTETVYEERQVVRYRPVVETTMRERRYKVSKPVQQTAMKEERKTVLRPVWEYRTRDASYEQVKYVTETSTREERRTVMRPVVETSSREEQRTVMRPVTSTVLQDQVSTAYRPVTTYRQRVVDQGQYVDQVYTTPGEISQRLRWQKAKCVPDPRTGECNVQRAGLYWTPKQGAPQQSVNRQYVPNPVMQQLAETRLVPEQVTKKIPVSVTRMQPELQVRKVPVQTTRMVAQEEVRQIPVSVQRPVRERVERQVEERRMRWVPEEMVRQVPVTTYRMVEEERVEQIPVKTQKMVAEYHTVQVPKQRSNWVEETTIQKIPRRIMYKVPIASGYYSGGGEVVTDISNSYPVEYPVEAAAAQEAVEGTDEVLKPTPAGKRPTLEKEGWQGVEDDDRDARRLESTKQAKKQSGWYSVRPFEMTRKSSNNEKK